ncbi:MAG: metallophosphoesterase family protein [Lawsonibacter sp.]|jgi:exonuclease SbcD
MLTFIHGADFHLDSPFSGLTPAQAIRRREEQRNLLQRLSDLARTCQAQLILLSGDLLDGRHCFRETAQALLRCLGEMPCPVFLAPGNHDCATPDSIYNTLDWPPSVHIFRSDTMERVELPQLGCVVYGRAFLGPRQDTSPLAGFHAQEDNLFRLGCLHGDLTPNSPYGPILPQEIADSGLHYLALGHIHQYSNLQQSGNTFWAYPGCPEGRGFDETGEKGVLVVQGEPGHVEARFHPLCQRRYQVAQVDLTGTSDPLAAIRTALPEDTRSDIYRILLTGESTPLSLRDLEEALTPAFFGLNLQDHTRVPQDLWQRRQEDSLTGLFLQEMWTMAQAQPDNPVIQIAARMGLSALEGGEDLFP